MASLIHLDTHVLAWLHEPIVERLSDRARALIAEGDIAVSPMAILELTYLREIQRLTVDGPTIFTNLRDDLGLRIDDTPFAHVVEAAHAQTWTRDPFDRLIAGHAVAAGAALLSADELLRSNVAAATW